MQFYLYLVLATTGLLGGLALIKAFLFFAGDYSAGFADWLYFSKYSIYSSRSEAIVKSKRRQNTLSVIIGVLVILDLLLLLLWHIS